MSKIFSVAMAIVVVTVTIEPRMSGMMMPKKMWRSLAPSRRAASRTSMETPLMAADRTTMAKPVCSQIMISISAGRLIGKVVAQGDRLVAERRPRPRSGARTGAGSAAGSRRRTSR